MSINPNTALPELMARVEELEKTVEQLQHKLSHLDRGGRGHHYSVFDEWSRREGPNSQRFEGDIGSGCRALTKEELARLIEAINDINKHEQVDDKPDEDSQP